MSNYVFSTLTCDNKYNIYEPKLPGDKLNKLLKSVTIRGGANMNDRKFLITHKGVATKVSDEDLECLNNNKVFARHKERGFIVVDSQKRNANKVAASMTPKDKSAPKVEKDFPAYKPAKMKSNDQVVLTRVDM